MQVHGPKRVYNVSALEFWFDRLTSSWEPYFPEKSLELGRRLYREGRIREIELGENDAIIHSKLEGRELYAVIDWNDGKPTTRASIDEKTLGQALAIAGLYEIEEMVIDEISPLPAEEKLDEPEDSKETAEVAVSPVEPPGRKLHLVFSVAPEGLVCEAEWIGKDGTRQSALVPDKNQHLLASEREQVIRLASLTRKANFRFSQKTHRYLLTDLSRIPRFLKDEIQAWEKLFRVKLEPSVAHLAEGVREVTVEARAQSRSSGALNLEWVFRTGEQLLSPAEAEMLLKRRGDTVLLPEAGLLQLSQEKAEAVREWQQRVSVRREELPKYLLLSLFAENRIELKADPELEAWREKLFEPPPPIQNLPGFLRKYQRKGVQWMAHLFDLDCHGLLADEMGLGKTVQVISLFAVRPTPEDRHLVVVPASVIPVWEKEFARFFPEIPVHVLRSGFTFAQKEKTGVWLASYTQLRRHSELLKEARFGYAVLDEGQLIKNPNAKVTRSCFSIRARHRLILTGTPLENRKLDLWSLFHFLMPNLLGTRAAFEAAAAADPEAFLERLRVQVAPFVLRRTKEKVASELPKKVDVALISPLTARQRDEYARICREGLNRLGDESLPETMRRRSFGLFSLLTRLRQVCCDPGLLPWSEASWKESGKILQLLEKLPEIIEEGHKIVIFSQFVALLNRVSEALEETHSELKQFSLTGATVDRQKPVDEFQSFDGPAVILVSLRAGGTGITLHAADYVFLLDPWWNPAVEAQAVDRVHRIGQTKTVFVYRMVAAGTVEERIQDLKEKKQDLFESVIGGLDGLGDLKDSFTSLRNLIELDGKSG